MKSKTSLSLLVAAAALAAGFAASAQTAGYVVGSPQATVRGGASQNVDIIEGGGTGASSGTVSVKLAASPFDSARKYYAKFTLTGNPNTNGPLFLRYDTIGASARQDVSVWTLDQDFPGFTSSTQTWNTAQANDTASGSGFLTAGPFTATYYQNFLSASGANTVDVVHQLHGPWGHMLRSGNVIYLALSSTNDVNSNGLRFGVNSLEFGYDVLTTGAPPSLSALANLTAAQTLVSATNSFTVGDPEDGPNNLTPTATSANQAIVADADIHFDGTGTNRTVYIVGGATAGTTTITVTVTDVDGNRATRSFLATVALLNLPPAIVSTPGVTNSFAPTNTLLNTPVTIPFSVFDAESPSSNLTASANVAAYSAGVLQSAVLNNPGGDNSSLSVTVTPLPGVDGVGVVQISCSDTNGNTTTVGCCVMVRANASVAFVDHFEYDGLNSKLTDQAPNFWTRRNASAQSVFFRSGTDPASSAKVAWIRPNTGAEDVAAPLVGGPYDPTNRAVLYAKFTATFADQAAGGPGINIITNSDDGAAFFRLSQGASSTTDFVELLAVLTNGVADPDNYFTVAIGNGAGTGSNTHWTASFPKPVNLSAETGPITFITRYDVGAAVATLWVNATSEADPRVVGVDPQAPVPIGYVGLFQARGYGDIYVDDMTVTVKIKPLITAVAQPSAGNLDIDFAAGATDAVGDFAVERAGTAPGAFTNIPATITSLGGGNFRASVAAPGAEGYYKVKRTPVTF